MAKSGGVSILVADPSIPAALSLHFSIRTHGVVGRTSELHSFSSEFKSAVQAQRSGSRRGELQKSRLEKSKMLVVEGGRLTPDERACVCKPGLALIFFHQRFKPGHELVDFLFVLFHTGK